MACACRYIELAQLHNDAHVVAVDHAGRQRGVEHESGEPVDREQVLDPEDEHRELGLERRERRLLLRLRERADGGPGGDDVPSGARLAEAISSPVHLAGV